MKWFLIIAALSNGGWGTDYRIQYPMPDKETCMEALKAAKFETDPKKRTVIIYCAQDT